MKSQRGTTDLHLRLLWPRGMSLLCTAGYGPKAGRQAVCVRVQAVLLQELWTAISSRATTAGTCPALSRSCRGYVVYAVYRVRSSRRAMPRGIALLYKRKVRACV